MSFIHPMSCTMSFFRIQDNSLAESYEVDLTQLPSLVFLQEGIPEIFDGDLQVSSDIYEWIKNEVNSDEIEIVSREMLEKLIRTGNSIAVIFSESQNHGIYGILEIHKLCLNLDVPLLHVIGAEAPKKLGIDALPSLIYYEREVPAIFEGDLDKTDNVLDWLMDHRTADTIEEITEEVLLKIIDDVEYVAVLFTGPVSYTHLTLPTILLV